MKKINDSGYGLTLGIQSRIDATGERISEHASVGNIYINRNQIGAVVGVQPFGSHGLSGTGPKAGGPLYLYRLSKNGSSAPRQGTDKVSGNPLADLVSSVDARVQDCLKAEIALADQYLPSIGKLPSPAGETNHYNWSGRGYILSLLDDEQEVLTACLRSLVSGNRFLQINRNDQRIDAVDKIKTAGTEKRLIDQISIDNKTDLLEYISNTDFDAIIAAPDDPVLHEISKMLANKAGPIIPILTPADTPDRYVHEKLVTRNTAAAGGDVSLLSA